MLKIKMVQLHSLIVVGRWWYEMHLLRMPQENKSPMIIYFSIKTKTSRVNVLNTNNTLVSTTKMVTWWVMIQPLHLIIKTIRIFTMSMINLNIYLALRLKREELNKKLWKTRMLNSNLTCKSTLNLWKFINKLLIQLLSSILKISSNLKWLPSHLQRSKWP